VNRLGAPRLVGLVAALLLGACRENLSPPVEGLGPDTQGPVVTLRPATDTTVTAAGVLNVSVSARDRSPIVLLDFILIGATFGFSPIAPNDTVVDVNYPVPLAGLGGRSFAYRVRARDVLNHETVTGTVTVTVR
jgi:hypothetical protein